MFVTIENIAQWVGEESGKVLVATGQGRKSSPLEAAQCVSRYVVNGDPLMHEANDAFQAEFLQDDSQIGHNND